MTLFFSAGTGAHYDTDIWPHTLPDDAVEVTTGDHNALMAAVAQGMLIEAGEGGAPVAVPPADPSIDMLARAARSARDAAIADYRWLVDRHRDEIALGHTTTLTVEDYILVLTCIQDLRDLPEQDGFPAVISWPSLPAELLASGT